MAAPILLAICHVARRPDGQLRRRDEHRRVLLLLLLLLEAGHARHTHL